MKFKYIVVYENNAEKFKIEHCRTMVTGDFEIFLNLLQYKLSCPITQLWYKLGAYIKHVCSSYASIQIL